MSRKIYVVSLNPLQIGERFEAEQEAHGERQLDALDALIKEAHITGMLLADVRRLLCSYPLAKLVSIGNGLAVEGVPIDELARQIDDGVLEENIVEDDKPRPRLMLVPALPIGTPRETPVAILIQHPTDPDDDGPKAA